MKILDFTYNGEVLGSLTLKDDGSVVADNPFAEEMLNSGWSPEHTTDQAIFERYLSGWNRNTYISVVNGGEATDIPSIPEVPVTR